MNLNPQQGQVYPTTPAPKRKTGWWILIAVLILLLICCIVAGAIGAFYYFYASDTSSGMTEIIQDNPLFQPTIEISVPANPQIPTQDTLPAVTEPVATMPQPTITPTTEPTPNVVANGISFSFTPGVAQNVFAETVPEVFPTQPDLMPGEVYPQHIKFTFNGYPLSGTFHTPHILVYPAKDYAAMDPSAASVINDLTQFLVDKPANPERIPFLPLWNAGQVFHSNIAYLSFKNGSGVRFLTMYAQAFYPVNNDSLFYTFQGLTSDGAYYIAAVLPVSHPSLPATGDEIPGADFDAFAANFNAYILETKTSLNSQPANSFTPDLALLDEMFESFAIHP